LFQEGKENNAMDTNTKRLSPLLTVAATSVIVLSAVGVAALTGMIPSSKGQPKQLELPQEIVQPVAPAISHPVAKPASPKPAARKTTAIGQLAVVESVREVKAPGEAKGVGAVAGGVAGGVLGHKLGKGKGLVTVIGAAGGAIAGHQIERHARTTKRYHTEVRMMDGSVRTVSSAARPVWRAGDAVLVRGGKLSARTG
jgi:outer membrane lipoprotein SlyB